MGKEKDAPFFTTRGAQIRKEVVQEYFEFWALICHVAVPASSALRDYDTPSPFTA